MDLDDMLFGDEVINTDRLTVPLLRREKPRFYAVAVIRNRSDLIFPDGISHHQHLTHRGAASRRW